MKHFYEGVQLIGPVWKHPVSGIQYPYPQWFDALDSEGLAALGVTTLSDPPPVVVSVSLSDQAAMLERTIRQEAVSIRTAVAGGLETEYQETEKQAQEYKASGYTGPVPELVDSWAAAAKLTGVQATEDILRTATRWRTAEAVIRRARLTYSQKAVAATTQEELELARSGWAQAAQQIRKVLGV
jgi:hypothetical protein